MPRYSPTLAAEYTRLFNTCITRANRQKTVDKIVDAVCANRSQYEAIGLGIPWYFIAAIHNLESSLSFSKHLHNGDPLSARTVRVPAGRPHGGSPPYSWTESATDALRIKNLHQLDDWSLARTLFELERYNGFGYRRLHPEVLSPYLWSFSTHYSRGKYTSDGIFSSTAVSEQCGAAVLLRRLAERGEISFPDQPAPSPASGGIVVRFSTKKPVNANEVAATEELQRWLNTFPGIFVKVDGCPGERTSDAWKLVTGNYLPGDPRE